jgi:hypothetical protein
MTKQSNFDTLLIIARPAAGKSEIINYLKNTPEAERSTRFHIGNFTEIDDFPMLWTWFEEDDLLEKMGKPRLHTDDAGYFKYPYLWDLLIERISLEHKKLKRDISELDNQTILIEFSRGSQHGGYRSAFQHLSDSVLERLAIIYIDVPFEESLRKNRRRFNPDRPDSILEHGLSDEKLNSLYKDIDWFDLLETPTHIEIKGHAVPYVIFDNQDDVTTVGGEPLGDRLQIALNRLWQLSSH